MPVPDQEGRGLGYTQAWHRRAWEYSPYCIPNELVAAKIGTFLGLPIPPFTITYSDDRQYFFSSLDFNFDRDELPPVDPESCWEHLPRLCAGVLLFDILVANCDRHDKNLVVDNQARPRAMRVWDHEQALLGGGDDLAGIDRLVELMGSLGISGGPRTGGNRHCLLDDCQSAEHFGEWFRKIDGLPDWFIDDACRSARPYGLTKEQDKVLRMFLKARRNALADLVEAHRDEFVGIREWQKPGSLF